MQVLVGWVDESHVPGSSVIVARLRTERAPGGPVRVTLDPHYTRGISGAWAGVDNAGPVPIQGRLSLALPAEFSMHPETIDVEVPAGGHKDVWTVIEKQHGLPGSTYAIYAVFQYEADGVHQTAVAESTAAIMASERRWFVRFIVPALAAITLLVLGYLCLLLGRRSARRAARRSAHARVSSPGETR
jgi:hypothetical protein